MKPHSRTARAWLIGLGLAVALYALLGFFLVPSIAQRQIESRGTEALGRTVTLDDVRFNPFTFGTELEQLAVAGRSGDAPLLSLERASLNFDAFESLFRWQARFGDVVLTAPHVRLAVNEAGELSIADLLQRDPEADEDDDDKPAEIGVDRLVVERGTVEFADRSRGAPFESLVQPIAFTLEDFSTAAGSAGSYRLSGSTQSSESFSWTGTLSAAPFASQGRIELTALNVAAYQPFLAGVLAGELRGGRADVTANYDVALGESRRVVLRDVRVRASDAALALPDAETPAVTLPVFTAEIPELDLLARRAQVAAVTLDGLTVAVVREADGTFDLSRLLATQPADSAASAGAAATAGAEPPSEAFALQLDRLALQNGTLRLTDRTGETPAEITADQIALTLTGASLEPADEAEVELALRWQEGPGTLNARGTVQREPLNASLQVTGSELELAAITPLLRGVADLEIASGRAGLDGRLTARPTDDGTTAWQWTGRMAVQELAAHDRTFDAEMIGWSELAFEGVDFASEPRRLSVQQIRLQQPRFNLVRGPEGRTNLAAAFGGANEGDSDGGTVAAAPEATAAEEPGPEQAIREASAAMPLAIEQLSIEGGVLAWVDRSGPEPVEARISELSGSLRGLSTEQNHAGELNLTGRVADSAELSLQGRVNLVGTDVFSGSDITLEMHEVGLDSFEPYVVRFLGYHVQQGRMRGDFDYALKQGELEGRNHVVLDDFYLGEAAESPDALKVPIKLALAVLRNRDGEVVLDVPVSGSLRSPEFSFADAIRSAFGNVLQRVASAPFALLGSMFGAPDTDLSQVAFPAGSLELTEEGRRKLEILTQALQERPELKLIIAWQPTPELDREAALQRQLTDLIAQQRETLRQEIGVEEATDAQALRALYAERILGEDFAIGGPGTSTEAAPQTEEERRAWYAQFWQWFWGPWDENTPAPTTEPATPGPVAPQISEDQMRQEILASIELDPAKLEEIARLRAEAARERLVQAGIDAGRIEVSRQTDAPAPARDTALVQFELAPVEAAAMAE